MKRTISLIFVSAFFLSCENIFKVFQEKDLLERPPSKRCGECHKEIYNQWKNSRHALAWISEGYKKSTNHYQKTKCFSCHIPYEIKIEEKPVFRKKLKEEGVNCVSCHFKESTNSIHGPYSVFSPPHPSTENPDYRKSKICSGCHQKTYSQWKKSNAEKECQDCHMPSKKGSLIQKFPFQYLHLPKDIHNHSFPTGKAKKENFHIQISKKGRKLILKIKNLGVPHNLPTADNGKPKIYLTVIFIKDGIEINRQKEMFFPKKAIPYKKEISITFRTPKSFDSVKILLERKLSWKKKKEVLLETVEKL
jgi:hypothetical protein